MLYRFFSAVIVCASLLGPVSAQVITEGDHIARNFRFASGETLPALKLHYRTLGTPQRDAQGRVSNAVLVLHGTGGTGAQFIRPEFSGELFKAGGVLDASRYFIVLPDAIGHGQSGKPSDGLRAGFPRYGYEDMVRAQHLLLNEGLKVDHLRLVIGTSMGGMQTWLWGQRHPDFMDALMPLASLPTQIAGRNRIWRRVVIDAIRRDPAWAGGNYKQQPPSLAVASEMLMFMSSNPQLRQQAMPTLAATDAAIDAAIASGDKSMDANDFLYQIESSRDYDPAPGLALIKAPLLAVNSADDLINPPELGLLEEGIKRVATGRALVIPLSPATRGHGSHTVATLWQAELAKLLAQSASASR